MFFSCYVNYTLPSVLIYILVTFARSKLFVSHSRLRAKKLRFASLMRHGKDCKWRAIILNIINVSNMFLLKYY